MTSATPHIPVLCAEVVEALAPSDGDIIVDATFGAGGYARAIAEAANCTVYGFDRDPSAHKRAAAWLGDYGGRIQVLEAPFSELKERLSALGVHSVDGVDFDLGVSSMQLDEAERGFSFRQDGPLSMRMDGGRPDARDVVNGASEQDLAAILFVLGEERASRRIAKSIIRERAAEPVETTLRLARIVEAAAPRRPGEKTHPATKTFQALRMFVNDELGELARGLQAAEDILAPGGRLAVVTFHSLEDRIVKNFLAERAGKGGGSRYAPPTAARPPSFRLVRSGAVKPGADEVSANPRARSAKLRIAIRTDAPAWGDAPSLFLPEIPLPPQEKQWS